MSDKDINKYALAEVNYSTLEENILHVSLMGSWSFNQKKLPTVESILKTIIEKRPKKILLDARKVTQWDSYLPSFLLKLSRKLKQNTLTVDDEFIPPALKELLRLAQASQEKKVQHSLKIPKNLFERTGDKVIQMFHHLGKTYEFVGELSLAFLRLITGRARFLFSELWMYTQESGPDAAFIVLLISFLLGVILAFMGAVQLQEFGAQIYVANLVVIGMTRDIGPIMTAIIMAGRTGASFAASIGTMNVNEEVDALKTMGFPAMDFLVLPRILAIVTMTPILVIYSDFFGILGGIMVGITMLDVSFHQYINQTISALSLKDIIIGIVKTVAFAFFVGLAGCQEGIYCQRSAQSVGRATTTAVVKGILYIIILDGVFAVILNLFGW